MQTFISWQFTTKTARESYDGLLSVYMHHKLSNISRTKSKNLNVSRLGMQLSLRNILNPGVKWRSVKWPTIVLPTKVRLISETWQYLWIGSQPNRGKFIYVTSFLIISDHAQLLLRNRSCFSEARNTIIWYLSSILVFYRCDFYFIEWRVCMPMLVLKAQITFLRLNVVEP